MPPPRELGGGWQPRLVILLLAASIPARSHGGLLPGDIRQDFRFAWLSGALFAGKDKLLAQAPFIAWRKEHVDGLRSLLSGRAGEAAALELCRQLKLPERVHFLCDPLRAAGRGEAEPLWLLTAFVATHVASGVDLAVEGVRELLAQDAGGKATQSFGATWRLPDIADLTNDLRERLIALVAKPRGRKVVWRWLQREMQREDSSAACPQLQELILRLSWSLAEALRGLRYNGTQTLPAPAALLEAHAARVLDAALSAMAPEAATTAMLEEQNGLTLLHQAALSGARAHALVLRCHARRCGMDQKLLHMRASPSADAAVRGRTPAELAVAAGHCHTAAVLDSVAACPRPAVASLPEPEAAWEALQPIAGSWAEAGQQQEAGHQQDWLPARECDFPSLAFDKAVNWREALRNHSLLLQPLRITGVGQHLAALQPGLFAFARAESLSRAPWERLEYEVGDIPYAANFRGETPALMKLGDYVRAMNLSALGSEAYWFSEHEAKEQPHKGGDVAITDRKAGRLLEDVRQALFKALGLELGDEEDQTIQFALGPALTGSPVHFHAAALNFVLMGAKRWAVSPPEEGYWSHLPARVWWAQPDRPRWMECMQRPGDLIFLPRAFTHGTLNVASTLALSWLMYKASDLLERPM